MDDPSYINVASGRHKAKSKPKKKSSTVRRLRVTFSSKTGYNHLLSDSRELLKLSTKSRLQERSHTNSPYVVDLFYENDCTSDLLQWEKKYPGIPKKVETYSGASPKVPDVTNPFTQKIQEAREVHMKEMSFPSVEEIDSFISTLENLQCLADSLPVSLDLRTQWEGQLAELISNQKKLKEDATQFHV